MNTLLYMYIECIIVVNLWSVKLFNPKIWSETYINWKAVNIYIFDDGKYCIAENFGGRKLWWIWQNEHHLPIFYPAKFKITKVANASYCKFTNIFHTKNPETINSPKFYPAIILCYVVYTSCRSYWGSLNGSRVATYRKCRKFREVKLLWFSIVI